VRLQVPRGQLDRQFQPLSLTPGQRVQRLTQAEVAEADVGQSREHRPDRLLGEELGRLQHRHLQCVADVLAAQPVASTSAVNRLPSHTSHPLTTDWR